MSKIIGFMTVTRTFDKPVFFDAAGIANTEKEDTEIQLEIYGNLHNAEPDVGVLYPYIDDVVAINLETEEEVELTTKEYDEAVEILFANAF
jgi:hypothetical protein